MKWEQEYFPHFEWYMDLPDTENSGIAWLCTAGINSMTCCHGNLPGALTHLVLSVGIVIDHGETHGSLSWVIEPLMAVFSLWRIT